MVYAALFPGTRWRDYTRTRPNRYLHTDLQRASRSMLFCATRSTHLRPADCTFRIVFRTRHSELLGQETGVGNDVSDSEGGEIGRGMGGAMLPLLVAVAGAESVVAFLLASRVASLVKLGQNVVSVCRGHKAARVIAKTVTSACVIRLASASSSALQLHRRMERTGGADADRVLARSQLLEIAFICFVLILELVVSSLDLSFKTAEGLKREVDAVKKKLKDAQLAYDQLQDEVSLQVAEKDKVLAEKEKARTAEVKSQKEIIFDLRQKLEQAQVEINSKERELKSVTMNLKALEKQTAGFQSEYTRVIDDNENLRIQLSLFDRNYSSSSNKKNS